MSFCLYFKSDFNNSVCTETMTDADYVDDLALLANIPAQDKSVLGRARSAGAVEYTDCISTKG